MLMLVCFFSVIAMAQIWIPWEMWNDHNRVDPCVHGIFFPDGGEAFINHIPMVSGECVCFIGYEGRYCEVIVEAGDN